ncbi:MAG: Gfo/Idh/MocA family oxidoreductase, partial [Candidatus Hydrogenedentes bacterium]|nr:Gfo/Idh/MocA family oxidoreductase [Candidatus Hydrogenedentota bacterium]
MPNTIGVVGAGGISNFHFAAFEQTGARVRIIADPNRANAQRHLDAFGAEYAADYAAVVSHPDVNTVAVFAPSPLHYEVSRAALEHGKHVICEKTLTLDPEQSFELGWLAEERGLCFYTSYMKRFFPAARRAKELMPRLGHIMSVYCRTYQGMGGIDVHTGEVPEFFSP